MKKIISIALLCAMLLSCFAGCAMQKGEVDVESYVEEAVAQDTAVTIPADWKNGLTAWDGTVNEKWYDASKTTLEIKDGKDLRAFLVEVRTNGNTFKDKVVKLVNNIDLGGEEWAAIISDTAKDNTGVFFAGEFNGDGKIIGNFKMTLDDTVADGVVKDGTNECATTDALTSHALLGSIGDGAYIHDLKVVGAEYIVNYKENSTTVVGGLFSEANNKVTLENLYISGSIKDTGSKGVGTVGGIVGKLKGNGPSVITNCVSNITISAKGSAVGGIVGNVNGGVGKLTVSGCEVTASVSSASTGVAGIVGNISKSTNNTNVIAISDCKVKANVSGGSKTAGILGNVESDTTKLYAPQSITISGCEVTATITAGSNSAGILGNVNDDVNTLTVTDCVVKGDIVASSNSAGIVGSVGKNTGALVIKNCEYSGKINEDNQQSCVGGILGTMGVFATEGAVSVTGVPEMTKASAVIEGCKVTGSVDANEKAGGIVGYAGQCVSGLLVKDCEVNATIEMKKMTGGVVGYVDKLMSVVVIDCDVAGKFNGERTSGGLIGTLNACGASCVIRDCDVTAELTFTLKDTKNNCGGGLIGKVDNLTILDVNNCTVASKITATYTPDTKASDDYTSGVGGLIGRVYQGSRITVSNVSVAGAYKFVYKEKSQDLTLNAGRLFGSIGGSKAVDDQTINSSVTFGENIIMDTGLTFELDGAPENFTFEADGCVPTIAAMGYQTRANKDNKDAYDLRYVFAISDSVANTADVGVGATVTIRFVDSTGKLNEKTQTAYASEIYTSVVDEDEKTYSAEAFNYKYVYTVVIEGIPAGYTFDANNVEITLDAFSATKTGDVVTTLESCTLVHGQIVTNP